MYYICLDKIIDQVFYYLLKDFFVFVYLSIIKIWKTIVYIGSFVNFLLRTSAQYLGPRRRQGN